STVFPITLNTASIVGAANTTWTGFTNSDWFTATNWSAGVPSSTKNCTINNAANNPSINGASGVAACKNVTISTGNITYVNSTNAIFEVYGSYASTGSVTQNDGVLRLIDNGTGSSQSLTSNSTISNLEILKTGGGTITQQGASVTINNLSFSSGNSGAYLVANGKTLILTNGVNIPNGRLEVSGGGILKINNGRGITVNGGTFKIDGLQDVYPQNLSQKGKVTVNGSGTWSFTATSGTVDLSGFHIDYIDTNGLNFGGSTTLAHLRSGHLTNLSESYASLKAIQFNTNNLPGTYDDIEWHWGPDNTPPASTQSYNLASSSGCGGNTISFNQWWGDFFDPAVEDPDPNTKVSETNCDIVISWANSPASVIQIVAEGYDGEALVKWQTGSEWNHLGFNIYRSQSPFEGFVQINSELVRNNFLSLGPYGSYYFIDTTVNNGEVYYYMIEDVATGGVRTQHGPVSALPLSGLGSAPLPNPNVNNGNTDSNSNNGNNYTPGVIANPGAKDLGHGIHILAQNHNSLRLEIIPPTAEYTVSSWNATYEQVNVPGYSKILTVGSPELAERVILIEVDESFTTAQLSNSEITEAGITSHRIQPAPSWTLDASNNLIASYSENNEAYSQANFIPNNYFNLTTNLQEIGGKKYVKIEIHPLKYNPTSQQISAVQKIILDIGLDGVAWNNSQPSGELTLAPSAVAGSIRIRYTEQGMYEISYDDLRELGVEGVLDNIDINNLRMYWLENEIPIEVISADTSFNSGDRLRFWGDVVRRQDNNYEEVVLTPFEFYTSGQSPLRFHELSADPTGKENSFFEITEAKIRYEENNLYINDRSVGEDGDHFFMARISQWNGTGPNWHPDDLTIDVNLPGLKSDLNNKVRLNVFLRGRTQYTANATHHLGVWVNATSQISGEVKFNDYYPTKVTLELPSSHFVNGINTIKLAPIPDTVPASDLEILDINYLEVEYKSELVSFNNQKLVYKVPVDKYFEVSGFSSPSIKVYDVSDPSSSKLYKNLNIYSDDGNLTYKTRMSLDSNFIDENGYRLAFIEDSAVLKPLAIYLAKGYNISLKNTTRQADMLFVGHEKMIDTAYDLVKYRESEGLNVSAVTLDQIYAEFGNGYHTKQAIKDFFKFAFENWQSPKPKYIVFLGDGRYDINNHLGFGHTDFLTPIAMRTSDFLDFASDDWFVTFNHERMPDIAIGRLPATNVIELKDMVDKIINYEEGERSPHPNRSREFSFYADESNFFEGFAEKSEALADSLIKQNGSKPLIAKTKSLNNYPNQTKMKEDIDKKFDLQTPLILTFIGHGLEGYWGDSQIYKTEDAKSLRNNQLPIVFGLNCLSANFADNNFNNKSIGEELVLNPFGGAIAYWGSTTYTLPEAQVNLNKSFFNELSQKINKNYSTVRIGDLIQLAKASQADKSSSSDVLKSWTLLGDPALKIPSEAFTKISEVSNNNPSNNSTPPNVVKNDDKGGGCGLVIPPSNKSGGMPPWALAILLLPILMIQYLRMRISN
ncbi:MAG: hypothetical protein KDD58_14005, partial [Bdellovibrionales bacterium]|nr:hypothetical protein [Bdellovibrionales bacterium]